MDDKKKSIFIIDDDSFLLDMYALKFSRSNFNVTTSLGSEHALEILRGGFIPEIILLDIMMPAMDGFELMQKMKDENLAQSSIKIILSNRGQASDISRGEEFGVAGYIVKASSTPGEVIEQVEEIVNNFNNK
jgi:two-component system, sensor histidine kinase ChiS